MTITAVGHMCIDELHFPDGEIREQFGGILYSVLTLAKLIGDQGTVRPVFGVGAADHADVVALLSRFPNIDTGSIFGFKGSTNRALLFYETDRKTRTVCSKDIAEPIPFSRIKPALDCDGLFVNMVSGFDITLETLDQIRIETREKKIPIHFDFHTLTMGVDADSKRFRRPITDWRRWCFMLNSIQLNQEEAAGLTAEKFDEPSLINHLMPLMVRALLITRGNLGVTLVTQDEHKHLARTEIAPVPLRVVADTTGCGDVFGAAFLYQFVKTHDAPSAARLANTIAAQRATRLSVQEFVEAELTDSTEAAESVR